MGWGQSCRLRHVTSGRYLAATADNQVVTYHRGAATEEATAFVVRESKVRVFYQQGEGTLDPQFMDEGILSTQPNQNLFEKGTQTIFSLMCKSRSFEIVSQI